MDEYVLIRNVAGHRGESVVFRGTRGQCRKEMKRLINKALEAANAKVVSGQRASVWQWTNYAELVEGYTGSVKLSLTVAKLPS